MPSSRYYVGLPSSGWHEGEVSAQNKLGFARFVQSGYQAVEDHMSSQHSTFHASLCFLALATLDKQGRPWASLVTSKDGSRGFVSAPDRFSLHLDMATPKGDPLRENLQEKEETMLIGGLGIELLNRRRNKFAGWVKSFDGSSSDSAQLSIRINSTLGNCPKYINVRELVPRTNNNASILAQDDDHNPSLPLPVEVVQHIQLVDSLYMASAYLPANAVEESHIGMNHRGGTPGFLRVDPTSKNAVYIPDYSGNRMMQSIGNLEAYPFAGLALPDWTTGTVLYLTGKVELYFAKEAKTIMRSVHEITKVTVTGYRLIKEALPLIQKGDTVWSSYNPPLRYLNSEPQSGFDPKSTQQAQALLSSFRALSDSLAVVGFDIISGNLSYLPGQYAIIDCSSFLSPDARQYRHMAMPGDEKTLNEYVSHFSKRSLFGIENVARNHSDGIRSWTISKWEKTEGKTRMEITMRKKEDGAVTPIIFMLGNAVIERGDDFESLGIQFPLFGIAGSFTPLQGQRKQLWISAGVGITPMLAFARSAQADDDIQLVLVCRRAEVDIFEKLIEEAYTLDSPLFKTLVFVSDLPSSETDFLSRNSTTLKHLSRYAGRFNQSTLAENAFQDVLERRVFICGTAAFRESISSALESKGVPSSSIHYESFSF